MKSNDSTKRRRKKIIDHRKLAVIAVILSLIISGAFMVYQESAPAKADLDYTTFKELMAAGEIEEVYMVRSSQVMLVTLKNGAKFSVINPDYDECKKDILDAGVNVRVAKRSFDEALANILVTLPLTVTMMVMALAMVRAMGSKGKTLYNLYKPEDVIKFDQVAGMSETKEEVRFAISQLKNASTLRKLGARPCKGIIFDGPPGTGKTLLAKAIAGEADVPFISVSGADFTEMFVGLGAARVRKLWEVALVNAPCVVFIDEIDAVGRRRSGGADAAAADANQTLNELLTKMDGIGSSQGIFVVGATNRIEDLDPALLRPGRFDKHLFIGPPKTKKDRDEIVALYLKNKKLAEDVTLDSASRLMFGMTGAEIENTLNESVMVSVQEGKEGVVSLSDIDKAAMKILSNGGVAGSHSSNNDIHISAVHEAGHAIVSKALGRKVSKISILSYTSGIGGMTVRDTDDIENVKITTKGEIESEVLVLLAGRKAEELLLGEASAGCSNDIERATILAYRMIYNFAMTDRYMLNPDILRKENLIIPDSESVIENVNTLLFRFDRKVDKMLSDNIEELKSLSDKLEKEETVYDY